MDQRSKIPALLAIAAWPLSLVYGVGSLLGLVAVALAGRELRRRPDDRRAFAALILGFGAMVFGGCIMSAMLIGPGVAPARPTLAGTVAAGSYPTLDGGTITLATSDPDDDRLVVVDVWATWCPPCVASIPTLEAIHRDLAGEFRVVSFAVEPVATVERWLERRRSQIAAGDLEPLAVPTYPIVARDGPMPEIVQHTRAYPTLWILAPDGTVLHEIVGMHDPITLLNLLRAAGATINQPSESEDDEEDRNRGPAANPARPE